MSSTQGHMIHSSNCNQEETLKPPILCEGSAADGSQGILMQQLHQTHFSSLGCSSVARHRSTDSFMSQQLHFVASALILSRSEAHAVMVDFNDSLKSNA